VPSLENQKCDLADHEEANATISCNVGEIGSHPGFGRGRKLQVQGRYTEGSRKTHQVAFAGWCVRRHFIRNTLAVLPPTLQLQEPLSAPRWPFLWPAGGRIFTEVSCCASGSFDSLAAGELSMSHMPLFAHITSINHGPYHFKVTLAAEGTREEDDKGNNVYNPKGA
jgi:hypothetical protein